MTPPNPKAIAERLTVDGRTVTLALGAAPQTAFAAAYTASVQGSMSMVKFVDTAEALPFVERVESNPHTYRLDATGLAVRTALEEQPRL